jgi:hypothetical protein
MKPKNAIIAGALLFALGATGVAVAQGTMQTISLVKVDVVSLETGYRTSKVVGSTVVNEADEVVGKIDDLIVTPNDKIPFAVLSVGGFLGMGTHFVVVPFNSLDVRGDRMRLRQVALNLISNAVKYNDQPEKRIEVALNGVCELEGRLNAAASVVKNLESRLVDWERARVRRYNDADQQAEYPGDLGLQFVEQMVEKQLIWGRG